jgi:hypothetical protein
LEQRYGPLDDYAPAYFGNTGREYWNETNLSVGPDGSVSQILPGRESRNPFDSGYAQAQTDEAALLELIAGMQGGGGGGDGTKYGNMQAMIDSIVPFLQQQPTMYQQPAMYEPTLMDASTLERFTPEELQYINFDPMRQNIEDVGAQSLQMIRDAYAPLASLRAPLQTSSGSVAPTAVEVQPELAALSQAMGVGGDYAGQVAAANQGIAAGANEFAQRGGLLDRVFNERRAGVADAAAQSQAAGESNIALQKLLLNAGVDQQQMANQAAVDQANVGGRNQANQDWVSLVNSIAMNNNGLLNQASQSNIGMQNQVDQANVDLQNQNRNNIIPILLELIAAGAGMGQTLDLSQLGVTA